MGNRIKKGTSGEQNDLKGGEKEGSFATFYGKWSGSHGGKTDPYGIHRLVRVKEESNKLP